MVDVNDLILNFSKPYVCPYCAGYDILQMFMIRKKSGGYSSSMVQCPACHITMKKVTLLANMSPIEWGEWIYLNIRIFNNVHNKFYDKVKWEIFWKQMDLLPSSVKEDFLKGFKRWKETTNTEMITRLRIINTMYKIWDTNYTLKEKKELGIVLDLYFEEKKDNE